MAISAPAYIIPCALCILNLNTSNKKWTLKNGYIYPFPRFQNNPLIFMQLSLGSFLNLFTFILNFSVQNNSFQISAYISLA